MKIRGVVYRKDLGQIWRTPQRCRLVSVRSGRAIDAGMRTRLNLGLNDQTVLALVSRRAMKVCLGCYRRFIQKYGDW